MASSPSRHESRTVSIFDEDTLDKMKACKKEGFPLCLDGALTRVFGKKGKTLSESMARKAGVSPISVSSSRDVWEIYEKHIEAWREELGDDVAEVVEFETLQEMKSMLCTRCPLYEKTLEKRKAPKR
jgi:hypothetical protein